MIFLIGFVKNLISGKNMNIDGNEQELKWARNFYNSFFRKKRIRRKKFKKPILKKRRRSWIKWINLSSKLEDKFEKKKKKRKYYKKYYKMVKLNDEYKKMLKF